MPGSAQYGARAPSTCYVAMRSVGGVTFLARSGVKRVNPVQDSDMGNFASAHYSIDYRRGGEWTGNGHI